MKDIDDNAREHKTVKATQNKQTIIYLMGEENIRRKNKKKREEVRRGRRMRKTQHQSKKRQQGIIE